jgi:hypothetical protein
MFTQFHQQAQNKKWYYLIPYTSYHGSQRKKLPAYQGTFPVETESRLVVTRAWKVLGKGRWREDGQRDRSEVG